MLGITGNLIKGYMGTGLLLGWFFLSMVYLWKTEKEKWKRILFVYFPLCVLVVFFNPLAFRLVYEFAGEEIYYRILWLLPISMTISYCGVNIIYRLQEKKRLVGVIGYLGLIMVSGKCIYGNPHFSRAENIYHMPEAVVEICDEIVIEGREVMGVFPKEMLQYVRQYTPLVCMPYGREELVPQWLADNPMFVLMEEDEVSLDRLLPLCKESGVHYLILPEDKTVIGEFEDYDYVLVKNIRGYNLYRDTTIYMGF